MGEADLVDQRRRDGERPDLVRHRPSDGQAGLDMAAQPALDVPTHPDRRQARYLGVFGREHEVDPEWREAGGVVAERPQGLKEEKGRGAVVAVRECLISPVATVSNKD